MERAFPGYWERHVFKGRYGTGETRLRGPRQGKANRISRRRKREVRSGSPRGS